MGADQTEPDFAEIERRHDQPPDEPYDREQDIDDWADPELWNGEQEADDDS